MTFIDSMCLLDDIKNIKGSIRDLRNFGILVGAIFLFLGLAFLYFGKASGPVFIAIGALLLASGFFIPRTLGSLYKAWMIFGAVIGFVMTNIILTVFFYVVLTPFALILKMSGKHFLDMNFRRGEKSYWRNRPSAEITKTGLEKQF